MLIRSKGEHYATGKLCSRRCLKFNKRHDKFKWKCGPVVSFIVRKVQRAVFEPHNLNFKLFVAYRCSTKAQNDITNKSKALSIGCNGPPELMIQTPNNDPQMHVFMGMGLRIATQIS
ncbi:hypothetical protein VNO77_04213 [Canavalia gladiata]|uniref:Uncharacterized protein n=1 Tax=Canavalia gladiata TaxID=3824 RepID=A0AAN9MWT1_CANGL